MPSGNPASNPASTTSLFFGKKTFSQNFTDEFFTSNNASRVGRLARDSVTRNIFEKSYQNVPQISHYVHISPNINIVTKFFYKFFEIYKTLPL
jgi:hypothetical protein